MGHAVVTAVWWSVMLSYSVALLRTAFAPSKPEQIEGHRFGDCTDEMFEAMREVDAMGLSGEPLLQARLPPRSAEEDRQLARARKIQREAQNEWVRIVEPDGADMRGFEIEFDPITGRTRTL